MAKKKIRYICPCCYSSLDMTQIHYACTDPLCTRSFLETCDESERARYACPDKPDEEIDIERSEYLGLDPQGPSAVTTREHIIRGSVNGICPICKNKKTKRLCPRCHNEISDYSYRNGTTIYPVLGSDGVGKSHYLSSLVNVMTSSYGEESGTRFVPSNDKTEKKFASEYVKNIEDGKCLPPTPSYENEDSRNPLMFDLAADGDEENARTFAFVDTSGSDLDRTNNLASLNISNYLAWSSGLIFVVDPLQLPGVREKLHLPVVKELPDIADKLSYIAEIIRDNNKMKPREDIEIPLAVVISKADLLIRSPSGDEDEDALFGPESALHIRRNEGEADMALLDQVDAELEEYMRRNASPEFLEQVDQFESHRFFAVSAIGSNPEEGNLIKGVVPYRVEDPLVWFLNMTERRKWF